ncbi:BrnT family toxin [Ottowia testudinis]|uniref:BrnT family toxin n=1 Tax=Ottowia testudinis TaxID=2816950 RepID=A0A975H2Q3_9BURK|nr:BrnT family toxin [Ottowia testudinis]QTD44446.1 BrnT family toxin [Ottowia testudinis]
MTPGFEWDDVKAALNFDKHGVAFTEAVTVFEDPQALTYFDDEHSQAEDRWITIGYSNALRILLVVSTDRENAVRIVSARKAEAPERKFYEQHNR